MRIFQMIFLFVLALAIVSAPGLFGCGDDDDEGDDDDGINRYEECVDKFPDCPQVASATCDMCPDNVNDVFNAHQDEIGNVYCHVCDTDDETGEVNLQFYATNGCVDEEKILEMFCQNDSD